MKFRTLFILLAFVSSFVIAQTQVPNGDFESWTLYPEGISGGGDFYMPVLADGTEAGLYNAVGDGWWHENMQNVAGRFYNRPGVFLQVRRKRCQWIRPKVIWKWTISKRFYSGSM